MRDAKGRLVKMRPLSRPRVTFDRLPASSYFSLLSAERQPACNAHISGAPLCTSAATCKFTWVARHSRQYLCACAFSGRATCHLYDSWVAPETRRQTRVTRATKEGILQSKDTSAVSLLEITVASYLTLKPNSVTFCPLEMLRQFAREQNGVVWAPLTQGSCRIACTKALHTQRM